MNSVNTPAALQWTFAYPQSSVVSFSAAAGSALTAAGKTLACQPAAGTLNCVASGPNALPISSGVIAVVSLTLGSAVTGGLNIGLSNALAVSPDGVPIGVSGTGGTVSLVSSPLPIPPPTVIPTPTGTPTSSFAPIRVNAGGEPYTDTAGSYWSGDANFAGGYTSEIQVPIGGTSDPGLYQTSRWGAFSYGFAVPNGSYTVTLRFADVFFRSPGSRVFNVAVNGNMVLTNFDIVAQVGPQNALDESFPVTVSNGQINIQFLQGTADMPTVSGIAITASGTSTLTSSSLTGGALVRVNAGGPSFTDPSGNAWSGDYGFVGGYSSMTTANIAGTIAPTLYQTDRFGGCTYLFSAPNGNYTVNLKFAETFFTTPGSRVFNVAINGNQVLTNFDIVAQAGAGTALDKSFPISVNGGVIAIQFIPGLADQPIVNGIEILAR